MFRKRASTVELSSRPLVLENHRAHRRWLTFAVFLIALSALGYLALNYVERMFSPAARVAVLESENARLTAALDQARTELEQLRLKREMDRATQKELENQVKTLNDDVSRLKDELNFFKKTKNKPS
ncbi:keratin [Nitrogeniibacter mangrovi]|uniref:Keratin n=1 Tax=Nitrogeniibacter mangrovi TaxID=2016596 RepID=A0A6C1B397_9RHOO|nr:hypothetical protein [Nitrogeniibacter mangrovi]QID17863.1 keratin [Nitrogeniibacter mangrovi]